MIGTARLPLGDRQHFVDLSWLPEAGALCAWRLLTDEDASRRVYQPEGDEDLAVFDINNRLLQVVQVKDYSAPLTLSDFKPDSADGFFARMHRRLTTHPDCEVWIASFGQIGPELAAAFSAPGPLRTTVASKLAAKSAAIPAADFEDSACWIARSRCSPERGRSQERHPSRTGADDGWRTWRHGPRTVALLDF